VFKPLQYAAFVAFYHIWGRAKIKKCLLAARAMAPEFSQKRSAFKSGTGFQYSAPTWPNTGKPFHKKLCCYPFPERKSMRNVYYAHFILLLTSMK